LAEALDAHRKRQQSLFPSLTMTEMYNVLEKLRSGEALSESEREIHEQGLVTVLRRLYDDIDEAVFEAYGWPSTLSRAEILIRLAALNRQRDAEERSGVIRWLRPEYQRTEGASQATLETDGEIEMAEAVSKKKRSQWPATLSEQVRAIRAALAEQQGTIGAEFLARQFTRARAGRVAEILKTLVPLGQAREVQGRYIS
jgi:hypothetical protein